MRRELTDEQWDRIAARHAYLGRLGECDRTMGDVVVADAVFA